MIYETHDLILILTSLFLAKYQSFYNLNFL